MGEKTTKLCRICLVEIVETEQYYCLNNDSKLMLQLKLLDFLPEIDLNITRNPIACNGCMIIIEEIYEFKQLCIQTEMTVRNLRQQGAVKEESLNDAGKRSDLQTISDDCLEMNTDVPICIEEPSKPEVYYCYNCDFNTTKKTILIRHLIHENLKGHMHNHLDEKPYNYKISNKTLLKNHKRKHADEKSFKCNMCDYYSCRLGHLKTHIRKHTGEKPFKCNICDYYSNQMANLRTHMRKHSGEKPFKCNVCDYCSTTTSNLKIHQRKHTGEKPFKCNICRYCTTTTSQLKKHQRMHTTEKPFKCNICDYCSISKAHLTRHVHKRTS